jgi:hypothetical protein
MPRIGVIACGAVLAPALLLTTSAPGTEAQGPLPSTWGLERLNPIFANKENVQIPVEKWTLDGFENDLVSNHRTSSARRTGPNARIRVTIPVAGVFYPGAVVYDAPGDERFALFVDGVQHGTLVANWDNNRERLFFSDRAFTFSAGSTLELRALTSDGLYRTESVLLLKDKPAARVREYSISSAEARPWTEGQEPRAQVTWITSWPVAGTVEWMIANRRGVGTPASLREEVAANNHSAVIRNLKPGAKYRFRIVAATPEGKTVASEWQEFASTSAMGSVSGVERGRVEVSVGDASERPATGLFPVTSGVPFPQGALASGANLRLLDRTGKELPLQTRVLGRWRDGSAKWVLVDFQAVPASSLALDYGRAVSRAPFVSQLKTNETADALEVVTGPLKLSVNKKHFGFPGSVWLDANRNGRFEAAELVVSPQRPGEFVLVDAQGTAHSSLAPPSEVVIEENGPLRATVRVSGGHYAQSGRKLFAYTTRIDTYAGQPYLRVQHTFINDAGETEFTTIRSLSLRLPIASEAGGKRLSVLGEPAGAPNVSASGRPLRLQQRRDDRYSVFEGDTQMAEGRRGTGLAAWSDGIRTVRLAPRDFWQNYPKDISVSPDGFELALCPRLASDEYADAKGTVDDHRLYYYLQDGVYKLRQGVAKTHEIWLDLGPASQAQAPVPRVLRAVAPPEWYADSKTFGDLALPSKTGVSGRYEQAFARSFQGYLENRETNREYGMLNFGDWWGERAINWGNSEYDTQYGFFLQFARTGDLRFFRTADEVELHNRDVDTVHAHSDQSRIGGMYMHCVGHTGDYYSESPVKDRGIVRGGMSISHTFIEGHLYHYFLTGDRRSLETAAQTARRFDLYYSRNFDFTDCRNAGWHLILSMAMYNATHDPFHLNAAKIIVERVLERQTPNGGWRKILTPGHCRCLPRHHGNAGFMAAVLLTGLKHYQKATDDPRVEQAMLRGAAFLIDDMWVPEAKAFRYTSCPASQVMAGLNFLLFDGIAYAHQKTKDSRMRQVLIDGAESALADMKGLGKGFTQYTRVAPSFIGYLDQIQEGGGASAARVR